MKKITLLVAIILVGFVAKASENNILTNVRSSPFVNLMNKPIEFNERGILFFVFANGDFDFNTRPDDSHGGYFYRTAGKRCEVSSRRSMNFGTLIEHDSFGRVRRIGNTFINYDFNDRVSRIGSVYMRYNRFALVQVGGLQLVYNRFGELVNMFGSVKNRRNSGFINGNISCNTYGYGNNSSNVSYGNNRYYGNNNNYNSNDNDGYYYRNGNRTEVDSTRSDFGNRRD